MSFSILFSKKRKNMIEKRESLCIALFINEEKNEKYLGQKTRQKNLLMKADIDDIVLNQFHKRKEIDEITDDF